MRETLTPSQILAGHLLGRPVAEYIGEKRSAVPKWSWNLIAERLEADTDGKVNVSAETLRLWFADEVAA